jgi:hypothetical protein
MAICRFQYAAKVVCGDLRERDPALAPGIYRTEVNVYNPNKTEVTLRKWLAVAIPPGKQRPGKSYPDGNTHTLDAGLALEVDCEHLGRLLPQPPPSHFVGFLIIESTESVDVTAVYTTGGIGEPTAPGIAVEQIKERRIVLEEISDEKS